MCVCVLLLPNSIQGAATLSACIVQIVAWNAICVDAKQSPHILCADNDGDNHNSNNNEDKIQPMGYFSLAPAAIRHRWCALAESLLHILSSILVCWCLHLGRVPRHSSDWVSQWFGWPFACRTIVVLMHVARLFEPVSLMNVSNDAKDVSCISNHNWYNLPNYSEQIIPRIFAPMT